MKGSAVTTVKQHSPKTSQRVEALLAQMTIDEKIGQLNLPTPGGAVTGAAVSEGVEDKIKAGAVGGIFGIRGAAKIKQAQDIAVNDSRLRIPLIFGLDVIHGHQTTFPIPLGLSCSWDMQLIEKTARMAAREATADGLMWTFSPMVDIARDPRWGRIAEGSGEDPFLGSAIAQAMVRGYQQTDLSDPTTMIACVKHFANYGAAEAGRDYHTTDMSRIRMYNEYLPPYKAAVDAGVETIMTSFNVVDYIPATGNQWLLTEVLRNQWGFDGYIVSDYTSVNEMVSHGMGDIQQVSALALNAGLDMDMAGEGFLNTLKKSLEEGLVSEKTITDACRRILLVKEKLGLFDDPYRYIDVERAEREILSTENRDFARSVAAQTFVLLKNEDGFLPLSKNGTIAIVGPLADSRRNMQGTWSVSGDHAKSVTVIEGIRNVVGSRAEILYAKGANISDDPVFARKTNAFGPEIVIDERSPEDMIKEAIDISMKADVVIAIMGEAADMSGEASSVSVLGLRKSQKRLLKALKETGKPIVMVLYNGRPMELVWENEQMDAILDVWFGGLEGGNAVADVLFGDVNPSGKLTTTFPYHLAQIPIYHSHLNTGRPYDGKESSKFLTHYLDIPNEPLFPFGYGLSYSTFEYSGIELSSNSMMKDGSVVASVTVKNTGGFDGKETVQLYIRDLVGSISRPVKELKGFQKISLTAGEQKKVSFEITEQLLRFYNSELEHVSEPGVFEIMIGPNSRDVQKVRFELK
jgi:beta-glucosidase